YQAGKEAVTQLQFERAVSCFSKAITLQPDQTQFYVERAEVYLQLCDFNSAALDYKHACYLEPQTKTHFHRLAFIYYLQGQCLCDQGMFLDALESFAKATELKPNFKPYHMRSLACLTALGRYSDCIRLVTNWLKIDPPSADLFTLRARLYHQINQAALCYYDLKAALRLNPSCADALSLLEEMKEAAECSRQQAVSKAVEGELTNALSKITTAVEKNPEKAQYYLFRGIIYRRLKDFIAAIEDLVLAVELCDAVAECSEREKPDNSNSLEEDAQAQLVLTYNDFAVHCFSQGFYSEAIKLLTKAIHEQRDESGLFINRGDCFLKQEEWLFALADYQQAEELDPQNRSIWFRLALIHNTMGLHSFGKLNFQDAADKFSLAIKYKPGVAQYYGNRAKAHTRMHRMEEAKLDALSALILGSTNDEASSPASVCGQSKYPQSEGPAKFKIYSTIIVHLHILLLWLCAPHWIWIKMQNVSFILNVLAHLNSHLNSTLMCRMPSQDIPQISNKYSFFGMSLKGLLAERLCICTVQSHTAYCRIDTQTNAV
uniref:Tetratricopeptide repeat domain 16 n=1 Tax=Pygocentrus nattereri TaxID=42514 RepID=A0A3B4D739_PYGNA